MNKIQYFNLVKKIKAELIVEGILSERDFCRIYSDKRKTNGYRTKFWGLPGKKVESVHNYITENYGNLFELNSINARRYRRIWASSVSLYPKVNVTQK